MTLERAGQAAARLAKHLELALAETGLSLAQYRLLLFLAGGPERASALASHLAVSPPSVTALVDGLVHRGLVQRTAADGDRRCVRHVLTPEGSAVLAGGEAAIAARLEVLAARLGPARARRAVEGLLLWHEAMEAAAEERSAPAGAPR